MSIFYSYSVGLQASKTVGTTLSDKTTDSLNSLHQAINNNLPKGSLFKLDVELISNEIQTINLSLLGLKNVRTILLKSDNQFGYSLLHASETGNAEPYWYLVRTALIDFNNIKPTLLDSRYKPTESISIIKLESPAATHPEPQLTNPTPTITVQLIVVLD